MGRRPWRTSYSATDYVQFGFFGGSALKDPKGLLEGAGTYVRHIKVRAPSDIVERAFANLLKQAPALAVPSLSAFVAAGWGSLPTEGARGTVASFAKIQTSTSRTRVPRRLGASSRSNP